ncbi:SDR family NAD(P)-dependent oxidoreductase [Actinomadura flavalba]|uniref:SDR family NAD(P)-dependent oxidoreductase n=1 Tax=Actinomadura flavalba TaxID=1120938 RepID=UPI0003A839D0|nr:SDR family oxidoreductase [Actinomadura flavalba]
MLLQGRNAIVYGGGGLVGGAMARGFAGAGARVHLAGRTAATLDKVASDIRSAGGAAETVVLDALDAEQVDAHADAVQREFGSLDISANVISVGDIQGTPLAEMDVEDFLAPVHNATRSTFLTTRAASRHMIPQGSGVILTFGGGGHNEPVHDYSIGGFYVAMAALDAMRRQLAAELGKNGIRVVTLHSGGLPESLPDDEKEIAEGLVEGTLLGRAADLTDVGNVAVFAASDLARSITGASINITAGAETD